MGMLKEFREFAMKGNVVDLAIGVIIGGAFGKIVNSMVEDLINPLLGLAMGKVDLTQQFWSLDGKVYENLAAAKKAAAPVFAYGNFVNTILQFVIIAFCIFLVIKQINRLTPLTGDNLPK
jgi:large conductance mechanosensitive channel